MDSVQAEADLCCELVSAFMLVYACACRMQSPLHNFSSILQPPKSCNTRVCCLLQPLVYGYRIICVLCNMLDCFRLLWIFFQTEWRNTDFFMLSPSTYNAGLWYRLLAIVCCSGSILRQGGSGSLEWEWRSPHHLACFRFLLDKLSLRESFFLQSSKIHLN